MTREWLRQKHHFLFEIAAHRDQDPVRAFRSVREGQHSGEGGALERTKREQFLELINQEDRDLPLCRHLETRSNQRRRPRPDVQRGPIPAGHRGQVLQSMRSRHDGG